MDHWKASVDSRADFSDEEKKSMMLSRITEKGMRMTSMLIDWLKNFIISCFVVSSFLELVPRIFRIDGVTSFLSEKLSQDPLEKFFGVQHQRGRTNENPSVAEFLNNTQSVRVINTIWLKDITGNCRGCKRKSYDLESVNLNDLNQPLKKRKRQKSY